MISTRTDAARLGVALEHRADLGHHRLRRVDVRAGPARHRAGGAERAHLQRRAVGHDEVHRAVRPQHRGLRVEVDDVVPAAVARRERVEDARRAGREPRPVLRRRGVAGVVGVAEVGLEDLVDQQVLARLGEPGRDVERAEHAARRERAVGGGVARPQPRDDLGVDPAAARASAASAEGGGAVAVGRDGVEERQRRHRPVEREPRDRRAAGRPAHQVRRRGRRRARGGGRRCRRPSRRARGWRRAGRGRSRRSRACPGRSPGSAAAARA